MNSGLRLKKSPRTGTIQQIHDEFAMFLLRQSLFHRLQ